MFAEKVNTKYDGNDNWGGLQILEEEQSTPMLKPMENLMM